MLTRFCQPVATGSASLLVEVILKKAAEEMQEEMDLFDAEQRKMKQERRDEAKKRKEEKAVTQLKAKAQKLDREEEEEC